MYCGNNRENIKNINLILSSALTKTGLWEEMLRVLGATSPWYVANQLSADVVARPGYKLQGQSVVTTREFWTKSDVVLC